MGNAKIHQFQHAVVAHHDVFRFEVAVHDAVVVGMVQGQRQLPNRHGADLGTTREHVFLCVAPECGSFDQLTNDEAFVGHGSEGVAVAGRLIVQGAAVSREVEDFDNVRVLKTSDCARFPRQPGSTFGLVSQKRVQHFNGDVASEVFVSTAVDNAHATLTDGLENAVVKEQAADEGIRRWSARFSVPIQLHGLRQKQHPRRRDGKFSR